MRVLNSFAAIATLLALVAPLTAQQVRIKGATPSDVVRAVNNELSSQGFKLEDSSSHEARFALDRGLVSQNRGSVVRAVPVVVELHLRFRQKADSVLEVNADEEVVGARGQGSMEFRTPVRSNAERQSMQQLLELVKNDLEARAQKQ